MKIFSFLPAKMVAGLSFLALGACSGLNLGTANMLQDVDFFNDNISAMSFAIDAPLSLLPQDNSMIYKLGATTDELGERHLEAVLERGDDILTFTGLTPPANNRAYHLFSFSEADKTKVNEFQKWVRDIRDLPGTAGGQLSMEMELGFCRVANTDVSDARITVYISLPDKAALNPIFSNVKLSEVGGANAADLPICEQT